MVLRCDSDLALLWLWPRPAVAAPILPLTWELPNAIGEDLEKKKKNKKPKTTWPCKVQRRGLQKSKQESEMIIGAL